METTESLKPLCKAGRLSGSIVVEQSGTATVLRKRHYPLFAIVWCYGTMGAVFAVFMRFGKPILHGTPLSPLFQALTPSLPLVAIICFGMATFFVALTFHHDRKPALLVFDSQTRKLSAPRQGVEADFRDGLHLVFREVKFDAADGATVGGVLYIAQSQETEGRPIFVEHALGHFRKRVKHFASLTTIPFSELPRITVE